MNHEKNAPISPAPMDFLTDLAAGEIRGFTAWRRRREIARDPALSREWAQMQRLRGDLRRYVRANPSAIPIAAPPALRFGGVPMRRRAFFVGYAALALMVMGIIAVRRHTPAVTRLASFVPQEYNVNFTDRTPDGQSCYWQLRGYFKGKAAMRDAGGRIMIQDPFPGSDPAAPLIVELRQKLLPNWPHDKAIMDMPPDFTRTLTGMGRHEIRDDSGALLATVELTPWTNEEQRQVDTERADRDGAADDFYVSPERLAPCWSRGAAEEVVGEIGVASGRRAESGVSWKLYGYAHVKATYPYRVEKPIIQEGKSHRLREPNEEIEQRLALRPVKDETPIIYWAVAGDFTPGNGQSSYDAPGVTQPFPAKGGYLVDRRGRWPAIRASGQVSGYGHHEIKNQNGETVLVLDVTPL